MTASETAPFLQASGRLDALAESPALQDVARGLRNVVALEAPVAGLRDALYVAYGLGKLVSGPTTSSSLIQLALFRKLAELEIAEVEAADVGLVTSADRVISGENAQNVQPPSAVPGMCQAHAPARRFRSLSLAFDPAFGPEDVRLLEASGIHVLPEDTECLTYRTSLLKTLRGLGLHALPTLQRCRVTLFLPHLPLYLTYNAMLGMRIGDCLICSDVAAALAELSATPPSGRSRQDEEAIGRFSRLLSRAAVDGHAPWFVLPVWRYQVALPDPQDCRGLGVALSSLAMYVCKYSLRLHGIISEVEPRGSAGVGGFLRHSGSSSASVPSAPLDRLPSPASPASPDYADSVISQLSQHPKE